MTGLLSGCPPPSQQALWHRAGTEDKRVLGGAGGPRSQARATEVSGGEQGVGVPAKEYPLCPKIAKRAGVLAVLPHR